MHRHPSAGSLGSNSLWLPEALLSVCVYACACIHMSILVCTHVCCSACSILLVAINVHMRLFNTIIYCCSHYSGFAA